MSAALYSGSYTVAAALAREFHVVFDPIQLTGGPCGQVPHEGRLDALEVVRSWIGQMINVRQIVSIRFREIHEYAVLQPGNIADRRAFDPAHDTNVRGIVHVAVIREQFLDKRRRSY